MVVALLRIWCFANGGCARDVPEKSRDYENGGRGGPPEIVGHGMGPTRQTPDFNWVELGDIGERHG